MDESVIGKAQWVRLFVPWEKVEPNAPTGAPQSNVNGQMSGQHTYNWALIDSYVGPAISRGLNVYLQIYFVPGWANGSPTPTCDPATSLDANGKTCTPYGYLPLNTTFLQDFAYNLANHYNNEIYYYGPLNEPNFTNNFDPYDQGPNDASGEYLNYYVTYIERPVRAGILAANSQNQLVGPDVGLSAGASNGLSAWISPLNQYFASEFNVWSVHTYRSDHSGVLSDLDNVDSTTGGTKPVWLTETDISASNLTDQANNVEDMFIDQYNRQTSWTKIFYHDLANGDHGLLDGNWNVRPAFTQFQTLYGHTLTPTLTANPINSGGSGVGTTTVTWNAPGHCTDGCQVWVGQPNSGTLFAEGGGSGTATTGNWVINGLVFSLYDPASRGTLATLTMVVH